MPLWNMFAPPSPNGDVVRNHPAHPLWIRLSADFHSIIF